MCNDHFNYINFNLKHFFLHFHNNKEALEYVLGWHPCYGMLSQTEYQKLLFKFENKLKLSHIKVFANSFVFFGKFISNSIVESDFELIKKAEKEVEAFVFEPKEKQGIENSNMWPPY